MDQSKNTYNIKNTFLPRDTCKVLSGQEAAIDNFALKLNKTVNFFEKDSLIPIRREAPLPLNFQQVIYRRSSKANKVFEVYKSGGKPFFDKECIRAALISLHHRQKSQIETLFKVENRQSIDDLAIAWRTIVGLGIESVYEVSMQLHPVYGIPYLPASAIKGILRSFVVQSCFCKNGETTALKDPTFQSIFGNQGHQGKVSFFDAFPQTPPVIEQDVINVHYQKYYQGTAPPADYLSPSPIFFLTIARKDVKGRDLKFRFYLGTKKENLAIKGNERIFLDSSEKPIFWLKKWFDDFPDGSPKILDLAEELLRKALKMHGIGAKTAVGYGYMKDIE